MGRGKNWTEYEDRKFRSLVTDANNTARNVYFKHNTQFDTGRSAAALASRLASQKYIIYDYYRSSHIRELAKQLRILDEHLKRYRLYEPDDVRHLQR